MLNAKFWTLTIVTLMSLIAFSGEPVQEQSAYMMNEPMIVDGEYLDAGQMSALRASQPDRDIIRFYVYDKNAAAEGLIYGFTNLYYFNQYLIQTGRQPLKAEDVGQFERETNSEETNAVRRKSSGVIYYYDNTNYVGPGGYMLTGTSRCFLNSEMWFNDRIESLVTSTCNCTWTILYRECGSSSSLWIADGMNISDLGTWNNDVSFIQVIE